MKAIKPTEEALQEVYLFNKRPTQTYMALVDNLYEKVWTDTRIPKVIGKCDTFNISPGKCVMHTFENNLMYHGEFVEKVSSRYFRYLFKVSPLCKARLKGVWFKY